METEKFIDVKSLKNILKNFSNFLDDFETRIFNSANKDILKKYYKKKNNIIPLKKVLNDFNEHHLFYPHIIFNKKKFGNFWENKIIKKIKETSTIINIVNKIEEDVKLNNDNNDNIVFCKDLIMKEILCFYSIYNNELDEMEKFDNIKIELFSRKTNHSNKDLDNWRRFINITEDFNLANVYKLKLTLSKYFKFCNKFKYEEEDNFYFNDTLDYKVITYLKHNRAPFEMLETDKALIYRIGICENYNFCFIIPKNFNIETKLTDFLYEDCEYLEYIKYYIAPISIPKINMNYEINITKYFKESCLFKNKFHLIDPLLDQQNIDINVKNFIQFDLSGVKSAAEMSITCTDGAKSIEMNINRPFLYKIEENNTNNIELWGVFKG